MAPHRTLILVCLAASFTALATMRWLRPETTNLPAPTVAAPPAAVGVSHSTEPTQESRARDAELRGLRAENSRLKAELLQADAEWRNLQQLRARDLDRLQVLSRPLTGNFSSSAIQAVLAQGEGVVTGGYRLPDGRRLFAFVQPELDGGGNIDALAQVVALSDATAQALGLDTLSTNADNTLQHGEIWEDGEFADVFTKMRNLGGYEVLGEDRLLVDRGATGLPVASPRITGPLSLSLGHGSRAVNPGQVDMEVRVEFDHDAAAAATPADTTKGNSSSAPRSNGAAGG